MKKIFIRFCKNIESSVRRFYPYPRLPYPWWLAPKGTQTFNTLWKNLKPYPPLTLDLPPLRIESPLLTDLYFLKCLKLEKFLPYLICRHCLVAAKRWSKLHQNTDRLELIENSWTSKISQFFLNFLFVLYINFLMFFDAQFVNCLF